MTAATSVFNEMGYHFGSKQVLIERMKNVPLITPRGKELVAAYFADQTFYETTILMHIGVALITEKHKELTHLMPLEELKTALLKGSDKAAKAAASRQIASAPIRTSEITHFEASQFAAQVMS